MGDSFAHLAATLGGSAPPVPSSRAERAALRLERAAAWLRRADDPEVQGLAAVLDQWLDGGGDLGAMLGAKKPRGCSHELPGNRRRRQAMADLMRAIVADEDGHVADPRQAAKLLALVMDKMPLASIIRERTGVRRVPTSEKSVLALLQLGVK